MSEVSEGDTHKERLLLNLYYHNYCQLVNHVHRTIIVSVFPEESEDEEAIKRQQGTVSKSIMFLSFMNFCPI